MTAQPRERRRLPKPSMISKTYLLTALAMLAFAGNSLLCRVALRDTSIDPATFTLLRLVAGAGVLWLMVRMRAKADSCAGSWRGALALFAYAAAFSYAYVQLDAGAGALLLFGAVQLSMIAWGMLKGERLAPMQVAGMLLATAGVVALLLPGARTPPMTASVLMMVSGIAWGAYSLMGKGKPNPLATTAGNFIRATPIATAICLAAAATLRWDATGALYAVASGALTSGIGYAIWYAALPGLSAVQGASVQLSVPLLTALAGSLLLGENLTGRTLVAGIAILGGIALVLSTRRQV